MTTLHPALIPFADYLASRLPVVEIVSTHYGFRAALCDGNDLLFVVDVHGLRIDYVAELAVTVMPATEELAIAISLWDVLPSVEDLFDRTMLRAIIAAIEGVDKLDRKTSRKTARLTERAEAAPLTRCTSCRARFAVREDGLCQPCSATFI